MECRSCHSAHTKCLSDAEAGGLSTLQTEISQAAFAEYTVGLSSVILIGRWRQTEQKPSHGPGCGIGNALLCTAKIANALSVFPDKNDCILECQMNPEPSSDLHPSASACGAVLRRSSRFTACLVLLLLLAGESPAQRLAVRQYSMQHGLAHNRVTAIHQDAKGYLWFGTWEGLSRFDGYSFVNYDTRHGLGHVLINSIAEDGQKRLWVGTNGGGVSRLIDDPGEARSLTLSEQIDSTQKFASFRVGESINSNKVNVLIFDVDGRMWCGTDDGIYRSTSASSVNPEFELVVGEKSASSAVLDRRGRLWFGCYKEIIGFLGSSVIKLGGAEDVPFDAIGSMTAHRDGRVFVGDRHGVYELKEQENSCERGCWRRLPLTLQPGNLIFQVFADSNGTLWISTPRGLIKYTERQTLYTIAEGLTDERTTAIYEDRDGNLWIGSWNGGVSKLSGEMTVSFTRTEGLPDQYVGKVIETKQGRIYASTGQGGVVELLEGRAVVLPGSESSPFNTVSGRIIQDRRGNWWVGSEGLYRFRGPDLQFRRGKRITTVDGISDTTVISGLYEDPAGRIWVGSNRELYFFNPVETGSPAFIRIRLPTVSWPTRMLSDRTGTLWVGGQGGLDRVRNGVTSSFRATNGLPETETRALFLDSRGWLWIGLRNKGVSMTKNPEAETPEFVNYSTADGLASDFVLSIAEDDARRIYLGTFKGLDRLDLSTGKLQHFTTADGLAGETIEHCLKDSRGNIWVATSLGVTRLNLAAEREVKRPPPVYLSLIRVAGQDLPLAETGTARAAVANLSASRNNLVIEFVGLSFEREGGLTYQYKLEGADANWSAPAEQRSVNYARLAPGRYRFVVRAINRQGIASAEPAVFEFRILPPVWQRWWFLTIAALFVTALAYFVYRYRVSRLLELERVRTRIATDLHDDIGSSLSRMAILSEVLKQDKAVMPQASVDRLTDIADTSRSLVDTMSDIVWSIDPRRDDLRNVIRRVRQFASDVLEAQGIEWKLEAAQELDRIKLAPEQRRHLFLIFKEAITNIARHSGSTTVSLKIKITGDHLHAEICDDGSGFSSDNSLGGNGSGGHGLANMRTRTEELGGNLEIDSTPGSGTKIVLLVPLSQMHGINMLFSHWRK